MCVCVCGCVGVCVGVGAWVRVCVCACVCGEKGEVNEPGRTLHYFCCMCLVVCISTSLRNILDLVGGM